MWVARTYQELTKLYGEANIVEAVKGRLAQMDGAYD